jgi:hypothetical protein
MRLPRLRFTLGQLIAFIGFMAVLCFLLTTYWPMALAIAIVTPGFVLDRRQGGAGILGAMLAGILGFGGIGVALFAYFSFKGDASGLGHTGPGAWLTYLGLGGLVCGTIFGLCAWSVLFLLGLLNGRKPRHAESSSGSAVRDGCEDRGLKPPRTRWPRP